MVELSQDLQHKAAAAAHAMQALYEAALHECGHIVADARPKQADVQLNWSPGSTAADLADAAAQAAAEVTAVSATLCSGRVYCYSCASSDCAHTAPLEPGQVFAGYTSTGTPYWQEFFNVMLSMDDSRTDQLFGRRSSLLLAKVVSRRRLIDEQLVCFGRNSLTYRIWAQLITGYFHLENLRAAMTVQVVETSARTLHLQVMTEPKLLEALANAPADKRSPLYRVYDVLAEARQKLAEISLTYSRNRSPQALPQARNAVYAMLNDLQHSIERKGRQQQRRSSHAEIRARQQRPVHKAHDDLRRAAPQDFFRDVVRDSIAVIGRGGRAHIFSSTGRHITTFILGGDELEKRVARRRYQLLDNHDAFRQAALASDDRR